MFKKAALVAFLSVGMFTTSAHAQMQQGYANGKPDVTVDRSVLQDLKGYQPPPMFGGDLMPPTTNRIDPTTRIAPPPKEEQRKSVEVTPPAQPIPTAVAAPANPTMTAPNAEDLLNHPTQNFHVLTERNASMTAPSSAATEPLDGPLLPLPDDDNDPAKAHARAVKVKAQKEAAEADIKKTEKKDIPKVKDDKKKTDKKDDKTKAKKDNPKEAPKKEKAEEIVKPVAKKAAEPKAGIVLSDSPKIKTDLIKPNPNAYRPKAPQSMPAIPPIQVEKNILPPLSGSPLPNLPPPSDTSEKIENPSIGVRMMDAALERQMETDDSKIKEQLAATKVKTLTKEAPDPVIKPEKSVAPKGTKTSQKTLVFKAEDTNLTDKMKAQIKSQILPEVQKDKTARIQILSFASAPNADDSTARRISLARALAVRDYLKEANIDVGRMDVRALPSDGNSVPPDKIDVVLLK